MRYCYGLSVMVALVLPGALAWGQGAPAGEKPTSPARGTAASADQQVATVLYHCNLNEVEVAKFAQSRLKSDEVKEFAAMLIKDHTQGAAKFQKLAGSGNASTATRADEPRRDTSAKAAPAGNLDWVRIQQEIGKKCVVSTKEALEECEGKDFDKAFLGQQIIGHMKAVAELNVLSEHASSELRGEIEAALKTTQSHLKEAKRLKEDQQDSKRDEKKAT